MMMITHILILVVLGLRYVTSNTSTDCMQPYCECPDQKTLNCQNFTSFSQLNFRLLNGRSFESVLIASPWPLDLNENLKLHGLILNGRLTLRNLRSVHAFYNPFRQILLYRFDLTIQDSVFNFFGTSQRPDAECGILNECSLRSGAQDLDLVFGSLKITEFTLSNVRFVQPMCPYFFKNSHITNFIVIDPKNSFGFKQTKELDNILNVNVNQVYLNYTNSNLEQPQWLDSQYILSLNMFSSMYRTNINSAPRLQYIQESTFNLFRNLKIVEINNVNMKDLLSRSKRWLRNLNYLAPSYDLDRIKLNSTMIQSVFQLIIWADDTNFKWTFTQEQDICLFRNFPHGKLVFPFLLFTDPSSFKCTCTVYWLYKYFHKYQAIYNLNQNIVPYHCFINHANWSNQCDFEGLFNKYCPRYISDPEEPFMPGNYSPLTTTTTQTAFTTTQTTTNSYTFSYPWYPTFWPPFSPSSSSYNWWTTSTSYTPVTSSTHSSIVSTEPDYKVIAFYMAIALCVVCVIVVSALIVLYYEVFHQNKRLDYLMENNSNQFNRNVEVMYI